MPVPDWARVLRCTESGTRDADFVVSGNCVSIFWPESSNERGPKLCRFGPHKEFERHQANPLHILPSAAPTDRYGSERRSAERQIMYHWVRLHWFELSALVLLGLNLWFVIKVLSVLRAVEDSLILLARWLDIARSEADSQRDAGNDAGKR